MLTLAAGVWSAYLSPYYLSLDQIAYSTRQFVFPGILAVGLAVVVILGEIDISLASTLAFGAVLFSKFSAFGAPIWVATPVVIAACAALGALNGVLVARLNLPSLAVTLGTMGAFRGLAFILGSETGYTNFGNSYLYVGSEQAFGLVPISFILFLVIALAVGVLMRRTVLGAAATRSASTGRRRGRRASTSPASRLWLTRSRARLAGVAALVWIGQYGSARGDNADGAILFVVTAVVLGGLDINGGRGAILGVVLALLLLGTMRNGMGLANIAGPTQTIVLGGLLIVGVLRPILFHGVVRGYRLAFSRQAVASN